MKTAKLLLDLVDARTNLENAQKKVLKRFLKAACALELQYNTFDNIKALQSFILLLRRLLKIATKISNIIQVNCSLSAVLSSHFRFFQNKKYQKKFIDLLYFALDQILQSID